MPIAVHQVQMPAFRTLALQALRWATSYLFPSGPRFDTERAAVGILITYLKRILRLRGCAVHDMLVAISQVQR